MQADPDVLIRAGRPLPPPNGVPPPAVLVGTTHGPGRMVSIDGQGRIVAFGDGAGNVSDIGFCTGAKLLAEAFSSPNEASYHNPGVAIRSTADLAVVWERFLAPNGERYTAIGDVACRAQGTGAGEVLAIVVEEFSSDTTVHHEARILLFADDGEPRRLWQGEATGGTLSADGTAAYLSGGPDGRQLLQVDLADIASPTVRTLAELPADIGTLVLSPDGRRLAAATTYRAWSSAESPPPIKAVVVDLAASPATVIEAQLSPGPDTTYSALWAGADRVAFTPAWGGQPVRIFDASLKELGSWSGWSASTAAVVGEHLIGLNGGKVVTAPLATGPASQWADLESGLPGTVVAFPGGASIGPPARPEPPTTTTAAPAPAAEPTGEQAFASLPNEGGGGTGGRPLLAGGAAAGLLAAGAAGLLRRRGLAKLPAL